MKKTTLIRSACFSALLFASSSFAGLPPITTGLYLQLEADSIGAADGDPVTAWTDTVGSQVFSGSATYVADWNTSGHAALSYDGASDMMSATLSGAPAMDSLVMIIAGTWRSDVQTYYDYMTSGSGTDRARIFEDRGDIGGRIGTGGTAIDSSINPLGYGDLFVVAVRTATAYTDVWIDNGGSIDFAWAGASGTVGSGALPKLNLAANDAGTEFSAVDIAELLIYDQSVAGLDSANINTIVDSLTLKYAPIPEPSTFALLMGGLGMFIVGRFRRA